MGKSQSQKMSVSEKKSRLQQQELNSYKKREMWIKRAGLAVLALVVLLFLMMGLTSDWWGGANKDSLRQFTPTSANGVPSTTGNETPLTPGGGGGGSESTTTVIRETTPGTSTSTTTNNTTNNNTTTPAPPADTSPTLIDIVQDVANGDTLDDVLAVAETNGGDVNCHNELLVFRVCTITVGDDSITLKALNNGEIVDIDTTF